MQGHDTKLVLGAPDVVAGERVHVHAEAPVVSDEHEGDDITLHLEEGAIAITAELATMVPTEAHDLRLGPPKAIPTQAPEELSEDAVLCHLPDGRPCRRCRLALRYGRDGHTINPANEEPGALEGLLPRRGRKLDHTEIA